MTKNKEDGLEHLQWAKDFMNKYEEKQKQREKKLNKEDEGG